MGEKLHRAGAKYQHVVFADTLNFTGEPLDLSPPHASQCCARPVDEPRLLAEDRAFTRWLLERAGIGGRQYREETLARRLPATLRAVRAGSAAQARAIVERSDALLHSAIDSLIIGVTSFFRDPHVYRALADDVLPRVTQRFDTRIWSVGCSDGAELYSVAMLLADKRALDRCQLLGTDCRKRAARAGAAGRYPAAVVQRDVPPDLSQRHFVAGDDSQYLVSPTLRAATQWRCADVMTVHEPGPWDLILCRNMAMYMLGESVARLWKALESSLRPGGYLVLGKAERPVGTSLVPVSPCIYRRERR